MDIVLTAAHCQGSWTDGVIVNAYAQTEPTAVIHTVDRQYRNPGFNFDPTKVSDDLMIPRLSEPVVGASFVQLNANPLVPEEGFTATLAAVGFEVTSLDGNLPSVLQSVELFYMPPAVCGPILEQGGGVLPGDGVFL
jgi:hypothetical protein